MKLKYYLTLITLLAVFSLPAQRGKKLEHLFTLTIDTANVTIQDTREQEYPYTRKTPYGGDTIIKKLFYAGDDANAHNYDYYDMHKYKQIFFDKKKNIYTLFPNYEGLVPKKAHFTFSSKLSTGWVSRLPERQNQYGQNTSPDDIFSWGKPVKTSYDPYEIFQPSLGAVNSLDYRTPVFSKKGMLALQYTNTTNRGIIPEARSMTNDFKLNLIDLPFPWFFNKMGIKANYLETRNNLTGNGSNYARLFYDIATTPPDFDNSNGGYTNGKAFTNTDGSEHRYAGTVDNPYRYISNSLDKETLREASAAFSLENNSWYWGTSYNYHRQHIRSGIMPYEPDMVENTNQREETLKTLHSALQYKYSSWYSPSNKKYNSLYYTLMATCNFNVINYDTEYTHAGNLSLNRITNDLGISLNGNYKSNFLGKLWLNANNSNTLNKAKVYFNEGLNVAVRAEEWIPSSGYGYLRAYLSTLKLHYSLSYTQNEAPLYYAQPHYSSTLIKAGDFRNYQEQYPLHQFSGLNTEKTLRNEIGIELGRCFYHRWYFTVSYFWNKTTGGIVPVYQNNRFELNNAVNWNKRGWEISYGNYGYFDWDFFDIYHIGWNVNFNFTSYKTMVKRLLTDDDRIPLAGFSDVSVNVLEGQPYGVIFGQKTDGTTGVIGNPTPDFTLNINPGIEWKNWQLTLSLGYVHGGDCWNGTRSTMNYLGISKESVQNSRMEQSPSQSPYYHAGITGIAGEAIEDASTVRFHTITLSYDFSEKVEIPGLVLSLGINNLIVWSAYSGIDVARPLFNYTAAQGLDYFNMPGTTNITFAVKMKF